MRKEYNKAVYFIFWAFFIVNYILKRQVFLFGFPGNWPTFEMLISYSYGFVRRGLLGTVVDIIKLLTKANIYSIIRAIEFIELAIYYTALFRFVCVLKKNITKDVFFFVSSMFFAVGGLVYYFFDFGQPDTLMASLTILAVLLITKDRLTFLVPAIALVCIMIHEGYALMFFPSLFSVLLYKAFLSSDKSLRKKYSFVLGITLAVICVLFAYFYFFSFKYSEPHFEEAALKGGSQIGQGTLLDLEYIMTNHGNVSLPMWIEGKPTIFFYRKMTTIGLHTLVILPIIIILIKFYREIFIGKDRKGRCIFAIALLSQITFIILNLVHIDQSRWYLDWAFYHFIFIGALLLMKDKDALKAAQKHLMLTKTRMLMIIFYCVYCFYDFLNSPLAYAILYRS